VRVPYLLLGFLACTPVYGEAAPGDAVITVSGFCSSPRAHGDACQTVVTRAQFEKLTEALQPGMPPELRLKVAAAYARMMQMGAAAEERSLDKSPAFAEEMRYARLQLLSQDLGRLLRKDADNVSEAELQTYYQQKRLSFERATLARIFIPRKRRSKMHSEEDMLRVAVDLRSRAVRGADPDELEAQAYTAAGIPGTVPHTRLDDIARATLPPTHETVMDLGPGEVSQVLSDPGGGHFIYKMIGKRTLSQQEAEPEIHKELAEQRYNEAVRRFSSDVVFNDAYFATPGTPPAAVIPATRCKPKCVSDP
jgi:hypothetical protein